MDDETCPACEGLASSLGVLGSLEHLRCRNCGAQFSRETVNLNHMVACPDCAGRGCDYKNGPHCLTCDGTCEVPQHKVS